MPLTTESELHQFLSLKGITYASIKPLSGGSINFCYRIIGQKLSGTSEKLVNTIVKHAEPYVRAMPSVPVPTDRYGYELMALCTVPKLLNQVPWDLQVRLPRLHYFWPEESTLCISDGGFRDLKDRYKGDNSIDMKELGRRLGTWLARLHRKTADPEDRERFKMISDENVYAKMMFEYTYNGIASVFKEHGFDPALGERIKERWSKEEDGEKTRLCHGDFWLSNIQVEDQEPTNEGDWEHVELQTPVLTVIDWENVRWGNAATDVARFAADAWMHDGFHGARGLCEAFLGSYLKERSLSADEKTRLVVHWAVHVIFYSRMRWTDEEGTKNIVRIGKEMLEAVEKGDLESWSSGPLALVLKDWKDT